MDDRARFTAVTGMTPERALALEPGDDTTDPTVAWDRAETDPCEAGTAGCSVRHAAPGADRDCQPW